MTTTIKFPLKSISNGWDLTKGSVLFYSNKTAKGSQMVFGCEGELYGWTKTGKDDKGKVKFINVEIPINFKETDSINEKIIPIIDRLKEEALGLLKKQIGDKFDDKYIVSDGVRCTLVSTRIPKDISKIIEKREVGYLKFTSDKKIGVRPINIGFYASDKYLDQDGRKKVFTNIKINIFHKGRKVDMEWVQSDEYEDSDDEILDEDMIAFDGDLLDDL